MNLRLLLSGALVAVTAPWVLWTWIPGPTLELWYVAALLRELRLFLAVPLLVALVLTALDARREVRWSSGAVLVVALLGLSRLGWLEVRALAEAREFGAPLSLTTYLVGPFRSAPEPSSTVEFARLDERSLFADVWDRADDRRARRPAIVRVHGGSWSFGERSEAPHWNAWLVEQGFVVFDVDYRLTPPPRWRDATGDVKCAVAWVVAHAETLRVDPERVLLMGASAGAHLALLAAYTTGDEGLPPSDGATDTPVAAVVALSPPAILDLGFRLDYAWWIPPDLRSTASVESLVGGTPSEVPERYASASPAERITAHAPPTFLVHGDADPLVRATNSRRVAERLGAVGVRHELVLLADADHLFERAVGGWSTQVLQHELARFLATWR